MKGLRPHNETGLVRSPNKGSGSSLPVTWLDPHKVPSEVLSQKIEELEQLCERNPRSADLLTCLGMAYAMDYRVHKSLAALTAATEAQPDHFWAALKLAELNYRLRALELAEAETESALQLASSEAEVFAARKQLQEIRRLRREGTRKPTWSKPLRIPALLLAGLVLTLLLSGSLLIQH